MIVQPPLKPRPVVCLIAHAHRDRAVAEAVCAGRFTHVGITLELGVEPDWLGADLPEDEEWRIEWSKFAYGLNLAHAFGETDDSKFLRAWERLVRSWIRQVPVDHDSSDTTGRRIQNWIYAWTLFTEAAGFRGFADGFAAQLFTSLMDQVAHLRAHLTRERNHRTLELYALFIAALALPELDPAGELLTFAMTELHRNLLDDVLPDGIHREASTHYHHIALRTFLGARENARRFGLSFPEGYDTHLERACEFALHCHRPDGAIPALSDSDTGSYTDLLELAAALLARPDFLYGATAGTRGVPPKRRHVSFPQGGYFIQRGGWGDGAESFGKQRFLIFDCGPLGDGGHGHYDLLNVEIAANGRPLIVDPGRYTYSDHPPDWRRWFKGTAAHNTVCVDRLDQTPYRRSKPKGRVAEGRFLGRRTAPGFDVMGGVARSPVYEAVHTRWIAFVADEYWIIADYLRGSDPHRYDLRFHLSVEAYGQTTTTIDEANAAIHAPDLTLVFAPARKPEIESGWIAPEYGIKLPAPVVSVALEGVTGAEFFTLVVPLDSSDSPPALRVHSNDTEVSPILEIVNVGPDGVDRDLVVWNTSPRPFGLGALRGCAAAAWLRESPAGQIRTVTASDVIEASCPALGKSLLPRRPQPARWVRWDAQQDVVTVSGEDP